MVYDIDLPQKAVNDFLAEHRGASVAVAREAVFYSFVQDELRWYPDVFPDYLARVHNIKLAILDKLPEAEHGQDWLTLNKIGPNCEDLSRITPEIYSAWLAAQGAYSREAVPRIKAAKDADIERITAQHRLDLLEMQMKLRPMKRARSRRELDQRKHTWNEEQRKRRLVTRLNDYVLPELPALNPIEWEKLAGQNQRPGKLRRDLVRRWQDRFAKLSEPTQTAWMAFHRPEIETFHGGATEQTEIDIAADDDDGEEAPTTSSRTTTVTDAEITLYLTERPPGERDLDIFYIDDIVAGMFGPAGDDGKRRLAPDFAAFRTFSAGVRRLLADLRDPLDDLIVPPTPLAVDEGPQSEEEIGDDDAPEIVAGIIPTGLTFIHGKWSAGKSILCIKLAQCVAAADDAQFEGMTIEHGRVLYATLDPNATKPKIKANVQAIRERLGLPKSERIKFTDTHLALNLPDALESFLKANAAWLPCKLLVIDSFYSAVAGDLAQASVMLAAISGLDTILRRKLADAIIIVGQETKDGTDYGSVFEKYGAAGLLSVTGDSKNNVTVTVERIKLGPRRETPLIYKRTGPWLELVEGGGDGRKPWEREGVSRTTWYERHPGGQT